MSVENLRKNVLPKAYKASYSITSKSAE